MPAASLFLISSSGKWSNGTEMVKNKYLFLYRGTLFGYKRCMTHTTCCWTWDLLFYVEECTTVKSVNCFLVIDPGWLVTLAVWGGERGDEGTGTWGVRDLCVILTVVVISQVCNILMSKVTELYILNTVALFWAVKGGNEKLRNPAACWKVHRVLQLCFLAS